MPTIYLFQPQGFNATRTVAATFYHAAFLRMSGAVQAECFDLALQFSFKLSADNQIKTVKGKDDIHFGNG